MKIRLYESLIEVIIALGVGIPLILGGVLDTWRTILTIAIVMLVLLYIITHRIKKTYSDRFLWVLHTRHNLYCYFRVNERQKVICVF